MILDCDLLEKKAPVFHFSALLQEQVVVGEARRRPACLLCARNTHTFLPLVLTKLLQTLAYCPHFINKESGASFIQGHTTSEWWNWGLNPNLFSIMVCTLPTPRAYL